MPYLIYGFNGNGTGREFSGRFLNEDIMHPSYYEKKKRQQDTTC